MSDVLQLNFWYNDSFHFIVAALRRLHLTWWRLHAGGGSTKVPAGYTLEYQHKTVCGHTPPLA